MNQSVMNDLKKGETKRILPSDIEIQPSIKPMDLIKKYQMDYQLGQLENKSPIEVLMISHPLFFLWLIFVSLQQLGILLSMDQLLQRQNMDDIKNQISQLAIRTKMAQVPFTGTRHERDIKLKLEETMKSCSKSIDGITSMEMDKAIGNFLLSSLPLKISKEFFSQGLDILITLFKRYSPFNPFPSLLLIHYWKQR